MGKVCPLGISKYYSLQYHHRYHISVQLCVTDYSKCSCLQQHTFTISQIFWARTPDETWLGPLQDHHHGARQDSSGVQECHSPLLSVLNHFGRIKVLGVEGSMAACLVSVSLHSESASSTEFYIKKLCNHGSDTLSLPHNVTQWWWWLLINFVLFYWLKVSHRLLPDSRREDMPGYEHQEVGIMDITWSLSATVHILPPMIHILSRCKCIYSPPQVFRIFTLL